MKKIITNTSIYLFLNIVLYALVLTSLLVLEHEQKSRVADTAVSLIRESYIFADFRSVAKDVEKIKSGNFTHVKIIDKDGKRIIDSVGDQSFANLKVKKFIWTDSLSKHLKATIYFSFGVDHLFWISLKILLGTVFMTFPAFLLLNNLLKKRQLQLIENEKIKILSKVTRQMSHDIRSPIVTLQHIAGNIKNISDSEVVLFKSALERIDKIANIHLEKHRETHLELPVSNELSLIVTEIINEKMLEYPDVNFEINLKKLNVKCMSGDLKRILSNLVNNGYESIKSSKKIIKISIDIKCTLAVLKIEDNGTGIPRSIIAKIGSEEITTKKNGNGLGVLHAVETLKSWDASFEIVKSDNNGTCIEIAFPILDNMYILIDDDELIRLTWETKARKNGVLLKTYKTVAEFENEKFLLDKSSVIYIDSDLGDGIKGEEVAKNLHGEGFTNISISSGFTPDRFKELIFLKSIISKTAPF